MEATKKGFIKYIDPNASYGFILCDPQSLKGNSEYPKELFFHFQDLGDYKPSVGERVSFKIMENSKGALAAYHIRKA